MSARTDAPLHRHGWLSFAAVMLISAGALRLITSIYYFADSSRINDLARGVVGNHLFIFGLWDLVIAVLAIASGVLLLKGDEFGRVGAAMSAMLVLIQSFLILRVAPWFGSAAILIALVVLYAVLVPTDDTPTGRA